MKQETLEEAAEKYSKETSNTSRMQYEINAHYRGFIEGAKWQQERSYSEEEVHEIIESYKNNKPKVFLKVFYNEWFEQFKKK